jgi:alkylation response protein AidB-like acyl-CoA dehydrogenase
MDLDWSEEQLELRAEAVAFARAKLNHDVEGDDRAGRFPTEKWDELASWGFFRLAVSEELGGTGLDPMTALLVTEGLGEGCSDSGLIFSAVVQAWVIVPVLLRFGTDEQKIRYLPGLMSGSTIGALAITEPDSGSDAFAMRTRAERAEDGGWRLRGSKTYATNGPIADVVVCFARTSAAGSLGGTTAFLVQTDRDGVDLGPPMEMQGLRTAPIGEIALDDVRLAADAVLGAEGFGLGVFNEAMEWERSFAMAPYVGMLARQLENACRYARERQAFGNRISSFQAVADTLVEMRLRLETARLLLWQAAWAKAKGKPALAQTAMAKLWISECAVASSLDAIQVHGGYGYVSETGVERDLRNAVGARIHSGTSQMQRVIIARSMTL